MKNRNSSPARSILESATQTASAPEPNSPQRGIGLQTDVPSAFSPASPFFSSEISNLKSAIPPSSSTSELSNLKSPDSPSALSEAFAYIATNPASEILTQFQSHFSAQSFDPENERDLKRLDLFLSIYAKLQNSAAYEQVSSAIHQMGEGPKREKLVKELVKIMSIQDRSIARAFREQESVAKEKRRIEREAKREQSQAAKHAREDLAFNRREDHLTRKEKLTQTQLDVELYKRANLLREQVIKYTPSQGATVSRTTDLPAGAPSSPSNISALKSEIASSLSALSSQAATAPAQSIESHNANLLSSAA